MKGELFNSVKLKKVKKNAFDLSHQVLTTGNMGDLIPIVCQEVVPGDVFRCRSEIFCRLMPMLAPVMQRVDIYTHYFFVPNRLLWNINEQRDSWKAFITGGKDGDLEPEPPYFDLSETLKRMYDQPYVYVDGTGGSHPSAELGRFQVPMKGPGSLLDYFGLPSSFINEGVNNSGPTSLVETRVSAMPFIAYQLIYDEYYRDQNFTDPVISDNMSIKGGKYEYFYAGSFNDSDIFQLRQRSWKKDYFTSALPWAQRGEPVSFPLSGRAGVRLGAYDSQTLQQIGTLRTEVRNFVSDNMDGLESGSLLGVGQRLVSSSNIYNLASGSAYSDEVGVNPETGLGGVSSIELSEANSRAGYLLGNLVKYGSGTSNAYDGFADLSNVSAINVQMLREGLRLQEWLERNAVGGARYVEQIYAHFGEMVPDATIQRPLYLGGGKQTIRISEVLSSVDTDVNDEYVPLGSMAGHGISVGRTNGFNSRKFTEHGYIIGIMSVIPKASYMQGINRSWSRMNKLDYYFPEFAHLGEQEVKIKELVWRGENDTQDVYNPISNMDDDTFGYQSRYAEYKYNEDRINGEFKTTLDYWHLGRKFDSQFELYNQFLIVRPEETERIFAVRDNGATHKLIFQIYHDMQAIRPMPKFATPYI